MNSHQQTLNTLRSIMASANAVPDNNSNPNSIYSNGNGSSNYSGVVSPPRVTVKPESPPLNEDELGMQIQRATSAPPVLDNILFASQSRYSHLFGDIRCEQNYENFYKSHQNPSKLPQPLDNDFFGPNWLNGINESSQVNTIGHQHHSSPNLIMSQHEQQQQQQALLKQMGLNSPNRQLEVNNSWGTTNYPNTNLLDYNAQLVQLQLLQQQQQHFPQIIHPQPIQPPQQATSPFYGQSSNVIQRNPSPQLIRPDPLSYSSVLQQQVAKTPQPIAPQLVSPRRDSISDDENEENTSPPQRTTSPPTKEGKRINISKFNTVRDALGKIYRLAKDQYGCRFLQKKLEEEDKQDLQMIFEEVYEHIVELMTDPFGNYLCQKLVEHCNESQKMAVIRAVSNDIVSISMNMHGTRAVQKLIECLSSPQQIAAIIEALRHHVVSLIKDLNGNHVIQRCLQKLSAADKQFIYDTVAGRCVEVATHKHGCCVLQRCIDYASEEQKMMLVREIASNALYLVQNPFGNYVVQYVLDLNESIINEMVISKFLGHISTLSTNKFSSNVMEKCLRIGSPFIKNAMVNEILVLDNLPHVLQDSYGNYVIQTALSICDAKQFQQFNEVIRPLLHLVRNTPYGKKIESKLNKKPSTSNNSTNHNGSVSNGAPVGGRGGRNNRGPNNRR
jgi:hypothetical protein